MPTKETDKPFISINGRIFEPPIDFVKQIESYPLEDCESHTLSKNIGFEMSFDMDKETA